MAEIRQNHRSFLLMTYKLYHHLDKVSGVNKSNCLNVILSLLKYAWKKNNYECGLRHSKIEQDTGLSRTTIYRSLLTLNKLNIIRMVKGKSGKTYKINTAFLHAEKNTVFKSETSMFKSETKYVSNIPTLEEQYNNTLNNKVDEIINKGLAKDIIVEKLAILPLPDLNSSINKHPYYVKLAIEKKKELERQKNIVPTEKILNALKNIGGKKSNAFYKAKVEYNKRNNLDWKGNPKK